MIREAAWIIAWYLLCGLLFLSCVGGERSRFHYANRPTVATYVAVVLLWPLILIAGGVR